MRYPKITERTLSAVPDYFVVDKDPIARKPAVLEGYGDSEI
jgi:hypothetical protein